MITLREQMQSKRISIRVLAQKSGVSTATIYKAMNDIPIGSFLLECITQAAEIMPVQQGHHHTGKTPNGPPADRRGKVRIK